MLSRFLLLRLPAVMFLTWVPDVLWPLSFILYVVDAAEIPERHGFGSHFYADDAQLYLTCRRDDSFTCVSRVSNCIEEMDQWMAANRLVMNPAKTDVLWCSIRHQSDSPLTLAGVTVLPSCEVRNLGVVFDFSDLSLKAHVSQLTARCYSCLRRINSCRRALTRTTAATVVNSLIVTTLDYCNGLLAGCTKQTLDKLQRVLNCSARVIFGGYSRHHVTPLLRDHLHWLRARERISFKLCILVYKAIHGLSPCYFNEMCILILTVPNLSVLLFAAHSDFFVPGTWWPVWHRGNDVRHINEVKLHRARLVLGLVTGLWRVYHPSIYQGHAGPLSLAIPPWVSAMSTGNGFGHLIRRSRQ